MIFLVVHQEDHFIEHAALYSTVCCNSAVQVDHVDQPTQLGSRSSHVRERSTRLESGRTVKPDHGVRTRVPGCCHVIGCYAKGGGQTVNRLRNRNFKSARTPLRTSKSARTVIRTNFYADELVSRKLKNELRRARMSSFTNYYVGGTDTRLQAKSRALHTTSVMSWQEYIRTRVCNTTHRGLARRNFK